jgi:hypothetical protein
MRQIQQAQQQHIVWQVFFIAFLEYARAGPVSIWKFSKSLIVGIEKIDAGREFRQLFS